MYVPAAQRALVGSTVRQYRNDAGLYLADTAGFLNCGRSKMSRIESGERGFSPAELRKVLTGLGVDAGAQDLWPPSQAGAGPRAGGRTTCRCCRPRTLTS
jgi:transcriptional regulator with XRE-family HTH domain